MPTSIGYQDLAALIARQPAVTERWRQHIRTSTFGTIHAATFSFPRPMGAAMPDPYFTQLASLDPRALDVTGTISLQAPIETVPRRPVYDFPLVNRSGKGDRLAVTSPSIEQSQRTAPGKKDQANLSSPSATKTEIEAGSRPQTMAARKGDRASVAAAHVDDVVTRAGGIAQFVADAAQLTASVMRGDATMADKAAPQNTDEKTSVDRNLPGPAAPAPEVAPKPSQSGEKVVESIVRFAEPAEPTTLFFGTHAIGFGQNAMQPWGPDEVPTVLAAPHVDPEIKRAALDPLPDVLPEADISGESVAPKGEVTGEGQRPRTPAERLNLSGASRVKHEKCLANAIYFEARGEVERGQMAVAQVILNRAFSGYYPGNVCDVVYQNAHRHLACQFTFACDNHRDVVNDQKSWGVATRIARDALDGKFWLPEIGKATHYHATYVNPWWVRTMTKHSKLGIHVFYRPRRWGEGEEIPVWGDKLDITGTITPMVFSGSQPEDKRAGAQPEEKRTTRRSIFDPVEEIKPGG